MAFGKEKDRGLFSKALSDRKSRPKPLKYTKGLFGPAIAQLEIDLEMVENSLPYFEKRGDKAEAAGNRRDARSFKAAIGFLGKGRK